MLWFMCLAPFLILGEFGGAVFLVPLFVVSAFVVLHGDSLHAGLGVRGFKVGMIGFLVALIGACLTPVTETIGA